MVKTSWIYQLRKEELIAIAEEFLFDSSGSVDELRKRLTAFATSKGRTEEEILRLEKLEAQYARASPIPPAFLIPSDLKAPGVTPTKSRGILTPMTATSEENVAAPSAAPSTIEWDVPASRTVISPVQHVSTASVPTTLPVPPPLASTHAAPVRSLTQAEQPLPTSSYATVIDQVRKWSVKFDGIRDPLAFIERTEELADVYSLCKDMLPRTMPELLKDRALMWYRNNNQHWTSWEQFKRDFLRFFLPSRYFEQLDDDIRQRHQRQGESFKDFVISLQNMMRHAQYSDEQKLERIFRNSRTELQLYVKRQDFCNLSGLVALAEEFEAIVATRAPPRPREERNRLLVQDTARINPQTACRRCGQEGHFARNCRNTRILFCWDCGRRGTRTIECCRRTSGNAQGSHPARGLVGSATNTPRTQ